MDGKNIADFIDPDIVEKLEALEREEERLQAEGFYDSDEDMFDSEDEREAVEAESNLKSKIASQALKKTKKNQARLPRTAGLRTINELSSELTAAGYDPSRIQERAVMLAKVSGAKRKREAGSDDGDDVDMDGEDDGSGEEGDGWMDVDDEGVSPKRAKGNTGAVIAKGRQPKSNRQLAGMRDGAQASKAEKLRNVKQRPRNMLAKAGEGDRAIKTKMPKHLFAGKRKGGKTQRR
jgi:nucleolar GTP-binding protein